jgi:succinylarginine dihydrolase
MTKVLPKHDRYLIEASMPCHPVRATRREGSFGSGNPAHLRYSVFSEAAEMRGKTSAKGMNMSYPDTPWIWIHPWYRRTLLAITSMSN